MQQTKEFITWDNRLHQLGNNVIDSQHKAIFETLNKLYATYHKEGVTDTLVKIMNELTEQTKNHFRTEESYMSLLEGNLMKQHIEGHHRFLSELEMFRSSLAQGNDVIPETLFKFLMNWFNVHMFDPDRELAEALSKIK